MAQNIQWKHYTSIVYKEFPALPREKASETYTIMSHSPIPQLPPKEVLQQLNSNGAIPKHSTPCKPV